MKKLLLLIVMLVPCLARADYFYYGRQCDRWQYLDTHTILLLQGSTPKALLKLPYCYIYSSSSLTVLTDTLGPYDGKILVDGNVCEPQEVHNL